MNQAAAISRFRRYQSTIFSRLLLSSFIIATKLIPLWLLINLATPFVIIAILFNKKNFIAIEHNLDRIYKNGLSNLRRKILAYKVFRNYSYYLIEFFYLSHSKERLKRFKIEISNRENLTTALERGKGIILLTIHMGNWEIGGLSLRSICIPLHMVYAPDGAGIIERWRSRSHEEGGIKEIPRR